MQEYMALKEYFGRVKELKSKAGIVLKSIYAALKKDSEYVPLSELKEEIFEINIGTYSVVFQADVEIETYFPNYFITVNLLRKGFTGEIFKVKDLGKLMITYPSSVLADGVGSTSVENLQNDSEEGSEFICKFLGDITRSLQMSKEKEREETLKKLDAL